MYQLIYLSSACHRMSATELINLLEKAREKNERLNITGMLLYFDGNFLQLIEGEESKVKGLLARIRTDARHDGIIVVDEGPIYTRSFPVWSMGFQETTMEEIRNMPGYTDVSDARFLANVADTDNYALDMLHSFRQNMTTRLV